MLVPTHWRLVALLVAGTAVTACGGDGSEPLAPTPPGEQICEPPDRLLDDGRCVPPGVRDDGCVAGESPTDDGSCRPAGVAPESCAEGFVPVGQGCEPILPTEPCPPGTMAVPGDATCHEVAPCGPGRWGDIPIEPNTIYVDGSYAGGSSDGSAERPFVSVQPAIQAAEPAAIVAIAAGTYDGDVSITDKPVRLWGVCPAEVQLQGSGPAASALRVVADGSGTELHALAVTGVRMGLIVSGAHVRAEQIWIHDLPESGIFVNALGEPGVLQLVDSLVARTGEVGLFVFGSQVVAERTVVRESLPRQSDLGAGRGINVQWASTANLPSTVVLRQSLIDRNRDMSVAVFGCHVTMEGTVVRDTMPEESSQSAGRGINMQPHSDTGTPSQVVISGSMIERNLDIGIGIFGSEVIIESTVVRDTGANPWDQTGGNGVSASTAGSTAVASTVTIDGSLLERNREMGVLVVGSQLSMDGVIVRETHPADADQSHGGGIAIRPDEPADLPSVATIAGSVIESNHEVGVYVAGSEAFLEGLLVRNTLPEASLQTAGRAVNIEGDGQGSSVPRLVLQSSVIEASHEVAVAIVGAEAFLNGLVVRDTAPQASDQRGGRGINIQYDPATGATSNVVLSASLLEQNHEVGLLLVGAEASIDRVVVLDTLPQPLDQHGGYGVSIQHAPAIGATSSVTMRESSVLSSHAISVMVYGSAASFEGLTVRDTQPRASDNLFGDGVVIMAEHGSASLAGGVLAGSARTGLAVFGASGSLLDVALDCNTIHINGESYQGLPWTLEDRGGNTCGCDGAVVDCAAVSTGLAPPHPLDP